MPTAESPNALNPDDPKARPRILLSAYAVDPRDGSESMLGWQRSVQAARFFDTWVICAPHESRDGIEGYFAKHGPIDHLEVVYVPKPAWMEAMEHVPGLYYLSYNLWQRRAGRVAERLQSEIGFDVVHQVSMCGYREPGYLWKLDAPFVWGPVGGTQDYPTRFIRMAGLLGGTKEVVRTTLNRLTLRYSRRVRLAAAKATELRAANTTVARDLGRALQREDIEVMLETGAPDEHARRLRGQGGANDQLRIFWAGELRAFKALPQLLDALSLVPPDVDWHLAVAGDGPERGRWMRYATKRGLSGRIQWLGWVPFAEMQDHFRGADLFIFTSLRDTSGNVVLEALSAGTPVIGPDHQGVGDMVDETCGFLVPVTTYPAMVAAYRDAIVQLSSDREWLGRLSEGARYRADHYSWNRQGERMRDLYNDVVARSSGAGAK